MSHTRVNVNYVGGNAYRISQEYCGGEGTENPKRGVGNNGVRIGVESVWDAGSSYLHRPQAGCGGAVGGYLSNIRSLCKVVGV